MFPWDCIILDESTFIRNPKAIRTKMCRKQFKHITYKAILSGLPDPESVFDYYEQMAFLNNEFLGCDNFWKFRLKYFHQGYTQWDWIPNKNSISKIKQAVNENAYVLTRKQAKIGSKKIYEVRFVELSSGLYSAYNKLEKEFALGEAETKWILTKGIWLARLSGGQPDQNEFCSDHKLKELMSLLQGELLREQIVIWFRFNRELDRVQKELLLNKISHEKITGKQPIEKRQTIQKLFQKNRFRILLMQLKCGKFGVDYSTASTAIYYSNSFEYEERSQSEDRIISPKKKEPVLILDLPTKNTIDEDIYKALRTKGISSKIFKSKLIKNLKERIEKC